MLPDATVSELQDLIRDLRGKITDVEATLRAVEAVLHKEPRPHRKRGRKFMQSAERLEVSERMRKYWAAKRAKRNGTV